MTGVTLTTEQIHAARIEAARARRRLVEVLQETLSLAPEEFVARLAEALHMQALPMARLHELQPAFDVLSYTDSLQRECAAFRDMDGKLLVALADPFNADLRAWAEAQVRVPFAWAVAHSADLAAYLSRHEETMHAMDGMLAGEEGTGSAAHHVEDLSIKAISEDTSPVVKLVNSTLYDALKAEASDVHLELGGNGLTIKYRIDGVLTTVGSVQGMELAEQVISRVKVMAELDIAERRVPQDGRFRVTLRGHEVDFRVSIMPSIFGEDAVLRILDKQTVTDQIKGLRLAYLGFDEASIAVLHRLSNAPYGMLLVTGPTGSGKTTTLYAAITEINNGQDKIITI